MMPDLASVRDGSGTAAQPGQETARPLTSVSLDLDNLWSYMKIHGDAGWQDYPSYLERLVAVVGQCLRRHRLTITVFVVGQDAALPCNRDALAELAGQGHEIGNHSLSHEPWFHTYSFAEAEREIALAEEHIERATGVRPRGYRGPGFSLSRDVLTILAARGYLYDASTFPTFLGPLARAYYFWNSRGMAPEERRKRKQLYGTARDGLRPIHPYHWRLDGGRQLLEIPVTTMPVARLPVHMSYLIYLAGLSRPAFRAYLRTALAMCRAGRIEPSFLLHPLDFLGGDQVKELAFFPGMNQATSAKLELFDEVMTALTGRFQPVTMREHAAALLAAGVPRSRTP
jgi:hypothetical protein